MFFATDASVYSIGAPVPAQQVTMRLAITVTQFTATLQSSYIAALSAADGVPIARHRITNFTAGSVVVAVLITPDPLNLTAPSPANVASILAAQAVSSTSALSNALQSVAPVDTTYIPVIATLTQYACADGSFAASVSACPAAAPATTSGAARLDIAASVVALVCVALAALIN